MSRPAFTGPGPLPERHVHPPVPLHRYTGVALRPAWTGDGLVSRARTPGTVDGMSADGHQTLCGRCDAVCCRLTVVLQDGDRVAPHLTTWRDGLHVMARDEEGWCVALDSAHMRCGCYQSRPQVCRQFAMAGPYCLELRADYSERMRRGIPLQLH